VQQGQGGQGNNPPETTAEMQAAVSICVAVLQRMTFADIRDQGNREQISEQIQQMFKAIYSSLKERDT